MQHEILLSNSNVLKMTHSTLESKSVNATKAVTEYLCAKLAKLFFSPLFFFFTDYQKGRHQKLIANKSIHLNCFPTTNINPQNISYKHNTQNLLFPTLKCLALNM